MLLPVLCLATALTAPLLEQRAGQVIVTGDAYRATFRPEVVGLVLDLRAADGTWLPVLGPGARVTLGTYDGQRTASLWGVRSTWSLTSLPAAVIIAQQALLEPASGQAVDLTWVATAAGLLLGWRPSGLTAGAYWFPPRLELAAGDWDGYRFWGPQGELHEGSLATLAPVPAYAGVSAWEQRGDVVPRLATELPALVLRSESRGLDLGVVLVDYQQAWAGTHSFLQRHTPNHLYLYSGHIKSELAERQRWAWLAPLPALAAAAASRVAALLAAAPALTAAAPAPPPLPAEARRPLPDFPPELRRATPVSDINQAVVYTVNEYTFDDYGLSLARKVGADVLIRGWFKWNRSPDHSKLRAVPAAVHGLGALFGGGITCSALYQGENGLTGEQWDDLATRGPAGQFIDAWDEPGVRHGSLSNPAYRDYLFRWCREQMDAGADYLFMDEPNAALGAMEGYDDYSNRDFRAWLLSSSPATAGWTPTDPRWSNVYRVPLAEPAVCPDGTMASFDYRAYLRAMGAVDEPRKPLNPLAARWTEFRSWRDQQAWQALTARIRAHATTLGRPVYLSGNGLTSDVDLQVLGVWGHWKLRDGQVDLSENQLPTWRATVRRGHQLAGKAVPVVFFHDWGFGTPPFPWMAVSPAERELWMRVRGAEIYAAGARFAFPVLGPFGCDAARDGTLSQIARQTRFYQRHRDFYTGARYLGTDGLASATANLSLAAWWHEEKQALLLHVINRNTREGALAPQREVAVSLAVPQAPQRAVAVSPDWEGEEPLACTARAGRLELVLPRLEAAAVVVLPYGRQPDLGSLHEPVRVVPSGGWARPERAEYVVRADGSIEHGDDLPDFLQGLLHQELRNPPTFVVDVVEGGRLTVNVRAVATLGARLELRIDGQVAHSVDLPDRDGKNDSNAPEYDQTIALALPVGRHRVTLDNVGGDWAKLAWIEFSGRFR